jgi:hypothetical protein
MRGVSASTATLVQLARQILIEDHPQTARQLHYRIFSLGLDTYRNDKGSYRRLCRLLTNARRLWRQCELRNSGQPKLGIPSNWIIDELRQGERVDVFENALEYIEAVRDSYRRDTWQDQPFYVELWGEKATVLGSLRPIASEWGMTLRVCRGFGSAGMEDQVGRLFEGIDKQIIVLYVGDFDPSGVLIEQDMHRRVRAASGVDFQMVRLAIQPEDISEFNIPPQKIKASDPRARTFLKQYGNATVELEGLPVKELKRRIVQRVSSLIDFDRWNRQVMVQDVELASIRDFAETMKHLPQIDCPQ